MILSHLVYHLLYASVRTYNTVEVGTFVWLKFCEFCKRRGICESLIRKSLHGTIIQFKVNTGPLLLFVVQPTIAHFSKGQVVYSTKSPSKRLPCVKGRELCNDLVNTCCVQQLPSRGVTVRQSMICESKNAKNYKVFIRETSAVHTCIMYTQ